ncbi:hypothetical protein FRC04_001992 [Tulasnella sp. 424]|nr:hypothetical protein FRC04_001992 [Tulasnella sp. 424]KAG8981093.1 hypothetical protein FRC05_003993 [Tulasnella sp. 425]
MSPSLLCTLALGALAIPSTVLAIPAPTTFDRLITENAAAVVDPSFKAGAPPIKILVGNDDGWAEANIRQLYADAKKAGNVVLSAPAKNGSGSSSLNFLYGPVFGAEYDSIPDGAPESGFNQTDPRLNYANGTPVAAIAHGFKELTTKFWGGDKPDIVLSGPNVGFNLGVQTLFSGTVGVANFAVKQGVPAIAFSGGDDERRPWTALQKGDVAHLYSQLAMTITDQVTSSVPFLPEGVSLNVNFPKLSANCLKAEDFKFVHTTIYPFVPTIQCTGSVKAPDEADVIASGACLVSISVMGSHKLDVGQATQTTVFNKLEPILSCADIKNNVIVPLGTA